MMIREKKFDSLSTEIAPTATKMVKFGPKKAYLSTGTLNIPNELCFGHRNLSLIPSITMIGEKKMGCHNTKKAQNRKYT